MASRHTKRTPKPARRSSARRNAGRRRWSREVTEHSNALDLEDGVFTMTSREMALSLKRSAERSTRRKSSPFRSAMSMLTFYENRAGRNLAVGRKQVIRRAKEELRKLYGKSSSANSPVSKRTRQTSR